MHYKKCFLGFIFSLLSLSLGIGVDAGESTVADRQMVVAQVGINTIVLDQVMEQWGPAWYEIISRAKREHLSGQQVDTLLQEAWNKALEVVVRDEIFYQEAVRSLDRQIEKIVNQQAATQGPGARNAVEKRIRAVFEKSKSEQVSQIIEGSIKSAGGFDNLCSVLKNRGITFEIWKERIIRKAYTYTYLSALFEPMGRVLQPSPRQVLNYYKQNRKQFLVPGKVVYRHIFLSSKLRGGDEKAYEAATAVYSAIEDKKITFADAATKYSDDKESASSGGLENGVSTDPEREAWLAEVREAAREQRPGELGPVLVSPRGCHLAILVSVGKPSLIPYAKAQKTILEKMRTDHWEKQSAALYAKLKGVVNVKIYLKQFPQSYSWENTRNSQGTRRIGFGADPGVNK